MVSGIFLIKDHPYQYMISDHVKLEDPDFYSFLRAFSVYYV